MAEHQVVSAHEYLKQQGASYVVFHPTARLLYLGFGSDELPRVVPQCVAINCAGSSSSRCAPSPSTCSWTPDQADFETLVEVHRALHLATPPHPPGSEQQQLQQQGQQEQQQPPPASQEQNAAQAAAAEHPDPFPAAKAGLASSRQVAEGSDGFAWTRTCRTAARAQAQQHGQQPTSYVPCLAGAQVAALWPGEPYRALWLMTPEGHIAGLDTTPQHILADRFEAVWRWALSLELGVSQGQQHQLSAVLLVHQDMTAAEVRLLADVLLDRLGFASLVVHLEPVAATFGNGATTACVVNMDSASTSITCVDDAVLLPPLASRLQLDLGLTSVAAALTGWMASYRHWPQQLQAAGLGLSCALGGGAGVYGALMLEELVTQQCYCPKESFSLGLVGQAMLEDQPPAVLPICTPGSPTVNYEVSLGSWAAVAAMVYFHPGLAPQQQQLAAASSEQQHAAGDAAAGSSSNPVQNGSTAAASLPTSSSPATAAAGGGNGDEDGDIKGRQYQHHHACVHDLPAAESMYLQGQLKARLEAGETAAPPVGLYLPTLDMPAPAGDNMAEGEPGQDGNSSMNPAEPLSRAGSAAAGAAAAAAAAAQALGAAAAATGPAASGDAAAGSTRSNMSLDEAVFVSIMSVCAGRSDLCDRLAQGILLTGPGSGLRGLGPLLERRLMQRFSSAGRQQVVNVLEPRAHPAHIAWKGGALLAALDAGRENWLPRHQWVQGGMVLAAPQKAATKAAGPAGAGTGSLSIAAAGRHAKLFYYCKAENGY